jgi:hypothetical protein
MKLKGQNFNTIEMIEAELQAELNTLTEHDYQDALKMAEALETAHVLRRGVFLG